MTENALQQQKMSGKGMTRAKSRRRRKNQSAYKLQFSRTEANKKRKPARHPRHFPEDRVARALYVARYGTPSFWGNLANATSKAKRRSPAAVDTGVDVERR